MLAFVIAVRSVASKLLACVAVPSVASRALHVCEALPVAVRSVDSRLPSRNICLSNDRAAPLLMSFSITVRKTAIVSQTSSLNKTSGPKSAKDKTGCRGGASPASDLSNNILYAGHSSANHCMSNSGFAQTMLHATPPLFSCNCSGRSTLLPNSNCERRMWCREKPPPFSCSTVLSVNLGSRDSAKTIARFAEPSAITRRGNTLQS
jgi:hypothetical protein